MRFFDRKNEIEKLRKIEELSYKVAQFTVISGRRRIGKTSLVQQAYDKKQWIYLFVARKSESELCDSFVESINEATNITMPKGTKHFAELFRFLMELAETRHLTVMIDEFQDFNRVNPSIFSEMQNIWDSHKNRAKINLIVCGSVNSLINKIFHDDKEPLYGRHTEMLTLHPFTPSTLKEIMQEYKPDYTADDLLALYMTTGGVAKYVELFVDWACLTRKEMLDRYFQKDSYLLGEGKGMLIEEFGRDYGTYFSILSLIAQGHNTRSVIEEMLGVQISGYIKNLTEDYGLIVKRQPLMEKSSNKNVHYFLNDEFLRFWFRYVFKYSYMTESGANQKLREIVERDYTTYSGRVLENWFVETLIEQGEYTRIGYWHDRKGENEIDIIAADELNDKVMFCEVKRQADNIDIPILKTKAETFMKSTHSFSKYEMEYKGLSLDDFVH